MSPQPALRAEALAYTPPSASAPILENIAFQLGNPEQRIGLTGPNGSGKTTLLRLLAGDLQPTGGRLVGLPNISRKLLRQDLLSQSHMTVRALIDAQSERLADLASEMATLESAMASLKGDALDNVLARYGDLVTDWEASGGYDREQRQTAILSGLGLQGICLDRHTGSLSAGERTRVGLASFLLDPPAIMLLDEPSNHLDSEAIAWLTEHLRNVSTCFVIASHDRALLDAVTNTTWHLDDTALETYPGPWSSYDAYCVQRRETQAHLHVEQQKEIRRLEVALKTREKWSHTKEQEKWGNGHVDRGHIGARAAAHMKRSKAIERRISHTLETRRADAVFVEAPVVMPFPAVKPTPSLALSARNISAAFGPEPLFSGFDVDVEASARLAVTGPNGVGKTTLLRMLAGELQSVTGEVRRHPRAQLARMHQDHDDICALDATATVMSAMGGNRRNTALRTLLALVGFPDDDVDKPVSGLSVGERGRLSLARSVASGANVLLLDEPTNHLDIRAREALERGLDDYAGAVVVVSHDRHFIARIGARELRLEPR